MYSRATVSPSMYFQRSQAYQAAVSGANPKSYTTVNALIGNTRVALHFPISFNFFAQDSWQVRPSLLVTYGIRYDRFLSPNANAGPPLSPSRRDFHNPAGERIAAAWAWPGGLAARPSCAASWGMFYDAPPTNLWFNALSNDGSSRSFHRVAFPPSSAGSSFFFRSR